MLRTSRHTYQADAVLDSLRRSWVAPNCAPGLRRYLELLFTMPYEEAAPVLVATTRLANSLRDVGPLVAFEIVVGLAKRLAK